MRCGDMLARDPGAFVTLAWLERWLGQALDGVDHFVFFGNRFAHSSSRTQGFICAAMADALVASLRRISGKPVYMAPEGHVGCTRCQSGSGRVGLISDIMCMVRARTLVITTPGSTFAQWVAHLHDGCHAYVPAAISSTFVDKGPGTHHVGYDPTRDTMAAGVQGGREAWGQVQTNETAVLALWAGERA